MRGRGMQGAAAGLALGALLAAAPLEAQETGDTLVLTLEEAIRLAEGGNPAYRRAVNNVGLNSVESRTTWATQVLPQASLSLFDTRYTGNVRRIAQDNFGNPIANPSADWVYYSSTNQSLNLSWSVQGASIFHDLRQQRLTNEGRVLAEDEARAQLRASVRREFYDVLRQRDLLEAERQLVESRRIEHELAERRFRLAQVNRVDLLTAELQVQQQALAAERQRGTYEQAKLALRTSLGDPALPPLRLAEEPLPVFDPSTLRADALLSRAGETNPTLRQTASAVSTAALGVKESKNAWWPDLNFGLSFARRAQARENSALFDLSFDEDLDTNFYISLSVPFFNSYFQNRQSIEQAEVELENQRESHREVRLQVEQQVRSALVTLQNQYASLQLASRAADIAEEALELAREEYRLGTRTFEQLRQTQDDEAEARRQLIEARYLFVEALIGLEEAVGAPLGLGAPVAAGGPTSPGG